MNSIKRSHCGVSFLFGVELVYAPIIHWRDFVTNFGALFVEGGWLTLVTKASGTAEILYGVYWLIYVLYLLGVFVFVFLLLRYYFEFDYRFPGYYVIYSLVSFTVFNLGMGISYYTTIYEIVPYKEWYPWFFMKLAWLLFGLIYLATSKNVRRVYTIKSKALTKQPAERALRNLKSALIARFKLLLSRR
ncbi:Protein of unknown function [Alteromonadaceae bacterium Bs31]|nr:Protein of unknown function [Alteromonadaceae bacterium Bs31]